MALDPRLTSMLNTANKGAGTAAGKGVPKGNPEADDGALNDDDPSLDEDSEAGPEDSGEPTDIEEPEPESEGSDGDESDEGDPEVADETGDEEPGDAEPDEEPEAEEEESSEDADPETEDAEPDLASQLAVEQAKSARLVEWILSQQQAPPQQPAAPPPDDDLPDSVLTTALVGSPDQIAKIPEAQRAKALSAVERAMAFQRLVARKGIGALYPEIQRQVLQDVARFVAPLVRSHQEAEADRLIVKHLDPIKDQKVRGRAAQIYAMLPGSQSTSWADKGKALEVAVLAAKGEAMQTVKQGNKQKAGAAKAQAKTVNGKKLKPTNTKAGSGSGAQKLPDMKDNESGVDYARRIAPLLNKNKKG